MNIIKMGTRSVELKYTFNSFKYMEDLDMSVMAEIDRKPFKILFLAETLLLGAVNHNPKDFYSPDFVRDYLETLMETGSLMDLIEQLMTLLQESNFFKSLQMEK